jgi:hypothetical protein
MVKAPDITMQRYLFEGLLFKESIPRIRSNNSTVELSCIRFFGPKEKGQSLIYKTLHRELSFLSQETKSAICLQIFIINFSLRTAGPD